MVREKLLPFVSASASHPNSLTHRLHVVYYCAADCASALFLANHTQAVMRRPSGKSYRPPAP